MNFLKVFFFSSESALLVSLAEYPYEEYKKYLGVSGGGDKKKVLVITRSLYY